MDAFLRWLIALMIVGADENPIELLPQRQSDERGVVPFQMREGVLQPGWYTLVIGGFPDAVGRTSTSASKLVTGAGVSVSSPLVGSLFSPDLQEDCV
jgi:hypothetical protein